MDDQNKGKINRRDLIKGLATIPVLGAFAFGWFRKQRYNKLLKSVIQEEVKLDAVNPLAIRQVPKDRKIRLGIIGSGGRGRALMKAAGFINPETVDSWKESALENRTDDRYEMFLGQEDLNIEFNGVCDVYDINADRGLAAAANIYREGSEGKQGNCSKKIQKLQGPSGCR